jgi:hypothetical protein
MPMVEENNKRYQENPQLYRTRQEINEHIFERSKTMGLQPYQFNRFGKVNGEHSLFIIVYNIKRCINILGVPDLIAKLKWNSPIRQKSCFY